MEEALTFDDVTLKPRYSDIRSRSECNIKTNMGGVELETPIIASPMSTVTESDMCLVMQKHGALGIVHRYNTIEEQVNIVRQSQASAAAVGATGDYLDRAQALVDAGVTVICIDVAHGHHILVKEALESLRELFGDSIHLMAGNVATAEGFLDLAKWGADSVRVGVGSGSICSTRMQTGHGIPNLSVIMDCFEAKKRFGLETGIIADGGIKQDGDAVKCLAAGADAIMCGSLLAGTDETPGEVFDFPEGKMKSYAGMASYDAQQKWRGKASSPEGIATHVPYRGSADKVVLDFIGHVKSGLSYSGARSVEELRDKAIWVKQTGSGINEGFTHILNR